MTRAVKLDRLLTLEDPMRQPNGAGGYIEDWTALGQVWAQVTPRSGRERGDVSTMRVRITLRAMPLGTPARPLPNQRFREGDRLYQIETVTESADDPRYLVCQAYEEVAA